MKPAGLVQLFFIACAAAAVYLFVGAAQSDRRRSSCTALCAFNPDYAGRNRTAPEFELPMHEAGQEDAKAPRGKLRLSSLRGKTVFVNFWASWCEPCMDEMPALADFARSLKNRDDMVLVTVDVDEDREAAMDKLKVVLAGEAPFTVLFDTDMKVAGGLYGTQAFPETYVIDPQGVVRARFDGARDWAGAMPVEIGKMVGKPNACPMEFFRGAPRGTFAGLCEDDG